MGPSHLLALKTVGSELELNSGGGESRHRVSKPTDFNRISLTGVVSRTGTRNDPPAGIRFLFNIAAKRLYSLSVRARDLPRK
eukprot:3754563-Amphidinium_carterae.1